VKKLIQVDKNKVEVLIIDEAGLEFITKCIPDNLSFSTVSTRKCLPYIGTISFLVSLSKRIFQFGIKNKALIASIVDVISPKIIISNIDNSLIMGQLDSIFTDKLVISVQNGVRIGITDHADFKLPIYFTFGEYEKELLNRQSIKYKEIHGIGSIKLGIFLEKYSQSLSKSRSICLVSKFWPTTTYKLANEYMMRLKDVYSNLVLWNANHRYKVEVAMDNRKNSESYTQEKLFLSNDINMTDVSLIERTEFSSYKSGHEALVTITMISTLGFELFGLGKKVLFCAMVIGDEFSHKEDVSFGLHKMPDFILLKNLTQDEFCKKINVLVDMDNKEYLRRTKEAREYYMKNYKTPPHHKVRDYIVNFLEKSTNNSNVQ
jgi:surface carbohydrate biosynthesis protein